MAKWRHHSVEFKQQAVERMKGCNNLGALARELDVHRSMLYIWRNQAEGRPQPGRAPVGESPEQGPENRLKQENQRLKEALGQKTLEIDFFKGALRRIKETRQNNTVTGGTASTPKSERGAKSGKAS
jgi:transposase-like protein